MPLHKLTQWLTYSLIEPLETAGLALEGLDELTALAEYRNGGLLVDLGVIRPRTPLDPGIRHDIGSDLIVEWRALTVALMDPLVGLVRARLGLGSGFTMPHLLQGGTWSAGRKIAAEPAATRWATTNCGGGRWDRVLSTVKSAYTISILDELCRLKGR